MRYEKAILEITTVCENCGYTSVRKVSMFDMRINHKKVSRNFHDNDICIKCYNSTEEEKLEREGENSLEIDYFYE
jgi:C4-type Zn-finger protein